MNRTNGHKPAAWRAPEVRRTPPQVAVIGGGSGASVLLRGLKRHTGAVSAIVTMFDSGGSSGILRREFDLPALGDIRQCLVALSDEDNGSDSLRSAVQFRFGKGSGLKGHSMGNLMLAALTMDGDVEAAVAEMSQMLDVKGEVIPVTLEKADLCAELEDGSIVHTESAIDLRGVSDPGVRRVFLDTPAQANPRAVRAIMRADAVVLGPGDLYTSIIPNLLATGVSEALQKTEARVVYVCNLMTRRGETDGFHASDFVAEVSRYMGGRKPDWVVVNTKPVSTEAQSLYALEGAHPVEVDWRNLYHFARNVYGGALAEEDGKLRHDSGRLADIIVKLARAENGAYRSPDVTSSNPVSGAPQGARA